MSLFPVYLYEEGEELPETGSYYLVAKSGTYFHKETRFGSGNVRVKGIPWLLEPDTKFKLTLPVIPGTVVGQALTFFRKVFETCGSEAYVTLLYSGKLREYTLWCPRQQVSHGSVVYEQSDLPSVEERLKGDWSVIGTIHSHCDFSAFHSGTDVNDEKDFDGVHVTLGHVNRETFSMVASLVVDGKRELLDIGTRFGNIEAAGKEFYSLKLPEAEMNQFKATANAWMDKVLKR